MSDDESNESFTGRLLDLGGLFLKVGLTGFGGPAVHIAMLEDEVCERRRWLSHEQFLDLVAATNLIPGPNSTEMAMHIGLRRCGLAGLVVAGFCFVLPAVLLTTLFAFAYVELRQRIDLAPLMDGIRPVTLAVITAALWRLGLKALVEEKRLHLAGGAAILSLLDFGRLGPGWGEVQTLLLVALIGTLWIRWSEPPEPAAEDVESPANASPPVWLLGPGTWLAQPPSEASLWTIAGVFLKVGAVLYGSGYVLIAYLQAELVESRGLLSQAQLVDAIAIGQFTPGPILSTAAFVGYLLRSDGGWPAGLLGATVASVCIFAPSFLFVAATHPWIERMRKVASLAAFLDAAVAASLGLMLAVLIRLAATTLDQPLARLLAPLALTALIWKRVHPAWLILVGAIAGLAAAPLGS